MAFNASRLLSKKDKCNRMKWIWQTGPNALRWKSSECFRCCQRRLKLRFWGSRCYARGTSVGANYREAYRARSKAEFIAKCGDSLRELEETAYWLELLVDGKMVPLEKLSALRQECDGDFCYDPEAIEGGFLIHPSSVCLFFLQYCGIRI